jgi:hypothetical protein
VEGVIATVVGVVFYGSLASIFEVYMNILSAFAASQSLVLLDF